MAGMTAYIPLAPVLTPCIGVCTLDDAGLCDGCHRSIDEITRWAQMGEAERQHFMDVVLPEREAQRT